MRYNRRPRSLNHDQKALWINGCGPTPARLMMVEEAPGVDEVWDGYPFSYNGRSGQELNNFITKYLSLSRENIYVTNIIKHYIDDKKEVEDWEWTVMGETILDEIDTVDPEIILLVGWEATKWFMPDQHMGMDPINAIPHRWVNERNGKTYIVVPCIHPVAAMRSPSLYQYIIDAFKVTEELLRGTREEALKKCWVQAEGVTIVPMDESVVIGEPLAIDTETLKDGSCYIVSFTSQPTVASLCMATDIPTLTKLQQAINAAPFVILQNAMFDIEVLKSIGITVPVYIDTMQMAFLIGALPLGLKPLAYRLCGMKMRKYEEVVGDKEDLSQVEDWNSVAVYSAEDPDSTLRVYHRLNELAYEGMDEVLRCDMAEMPLVMAMRKRGLIINTRTCTDLESEMTVDNIMLRDRMIREFPIVQRAVPVPPKPKIRLTKKGLPYKNNAKPKPIEQFNPNSDKQVAKLLYTILDLGRGLKINKTVNGGSVDHDHMVKLERRHPIVPLLMEYTERQTLIDTYTKKIPTFVKEDGAVHADFSMVRVPHSGRLACSEPNLLAQPTRTAAGKRIRDVYEVRPGYVMIEGDYSQVEMRVMADISGDELMRKIFRSSEDIHTQTAMRIFGLPEDKIDGSLHRRPAKCFHPDTEVLTMKGWKRIIDLDPYEKVVQAIPDRDGYVDLEWVVPDEVFTQHHPSGELVHLHNIGIDIRVTPDHRMLRWTRGGTPKVCTPEEFANGDRYFANAGIMDQPDLNIPDTMLRLAVALQADGSITQWRSIKWGFSKERKCKRLKRLLIAAGIPFNEAFHHNGTNGLSHAFSVHEPDAVELLQLLDSDKTFPWWWLGLSVRQKRIVLDEIQYWDGHAADKRIEVSSVIAKNLDVLQALATTCGWKARIGASDKMSIRKGGTSRLGNVKFTTEPYTDKVACLSVPSSFVLVRDRGVTLICGQTAGFGVLNDISAQALARELLTMGAAGWDEAKCQALIDSWFGVYRGVREFKDAVAREVLRTGCVYDMFGRRELVPQVKSCHELIREGGIRVAGNQGIQSGAQGIIKRAMGVLWQEYFCEWTQQGIAYPLIQIHDSLVVEAREDMWEYVMMCMKDVMENVVQLSVPLLVDFKMSPRSWGKLKSVE